MSWSLRDNMIVEHTVVVRVVNVSRSIRKLKALKTFVC